MSSEQKENGLSGQKHVPRDAQIIANILEEMGVEQYEPQCINQLLEFLHRYTGDVLEDAWDYKEHAGRKSVELSDVRMATEAMQRHTFIQPPSREVLLGIVGAKNSIPLPIVPSKFGVLIPPEDQCLTAPNFEVDYKKDEDETEKQQGDTQTDSNMEIE